MSDYKEFVSRFPLQEKSIEKEGYEYHHIIPKSVQEEPDDSGVLLLPSQHLWAHILYDRENGTNTSSFLLSRCNLGIKDISSYEDCLICDSIIKKLNDQRREWALTHNGKEEPARKSVLQMWNAGVSAMSISKELKISKARVYQILNPNKKLSTKQEIECLKEENIKLKEEIEFLKGILKKLSLS